MSSCPKCSHPAEEKDLFCGNCGFRIPAPDATLAVTQNELKLTDIQFNLGLIYFKKGDYQKAEETFEKVVKLDQNNENAARMLLQVKQML